MRTELIAPDAAGIARAAALLRAGALVAFPTETVYGLGANALDRSAVARIYAAKSRPSDNPLIVHVAGPEEIGRWAEADERAWLLVDRFWPGPLTLVLPSRGLVGDGTVALRMPAEPIAQHLLAHCARPVSAPSANRSGRPSPTTAEAVLEEMDGRIEAVLAGPPATVGIESTVLDLTGPTPLILRPGDIDRLQIAKALSADVGSAGGSQRSPGTRYRHYAPDVPVRLFAGSEDWLRRELAQALLATPEAVYIGLAATAPAGARGLLAADLRELQRSLYGALRDAEVRRVPVIAAWPAPSPEAAGVRDRLWRASGGHVTQEREREQQKEGSGEIS